MLGTVLGTVLVQEWEKESALVLVHGSDISTDLDRYPGQMMPDISPLIVDIHRHWHHEHTNDTIEALFLTCRNIVRTHCIRNILLLAVALVLELVLELVLVLVAVLAMVLAMVLVSALEE